MIIEINSPAKINLGLEILERRSDGYHNVDMIMQTVNLYDTIIISESDSRNIEVSCNKKLRCKNEQNIAYITAERFFSYTKIDRKGIKIDIRKRIPMCAGLAGGSGDAAAVIIGLNRMFNTKLSIEGMMELGDTIGKDVPYCILGGTMRAEGTGSLLTKISEIDNVFIVLVKPELFISTGQAYNLSDKYKFHHNTRIEELILLIQSGEINYMSSKMFNRFDELMPNPVIADIKNKMINSGATGACMSGSGSTVFGIFDDINIANNSFLEFKKLFKDVFICKPINHGVKIIKIIE